MSELLLLHSISHPINLSEIALFSPETEFVKKKGKSHPFRFLVFDLPPIAQQSVYISIEADRYWAIKTVINRFFYITCTGPKRKIPRAPSRPHAAAAGLMLYGREAGQLRVKCGGWMENFGIFWKNNFKGLQHSEHRLCTIHPRRRGNLASLYEHLVCPIF